MVAPVPCRCSSIDYVAWVAREQGQVAKSFYEDVTDKKAMLRDLYEYLTGDLASSAHLASSANHQFRSPSLGLHACYGSASKAATFVPT